jgi:hypothetical protein
MHEHAAPCCTRIVSDCSALSRMHQALGMVSRPGKRTTACRILVAVRTRCEEVETGLHSVIALCKRYDGAALARADAQRFGTLHGLAWPVLAPAAPAPPVPRCHHGILALGVGRTAYPQSPRTAASRSAASPLVNPARAASPSLRSSAVCFSVAGCCRQGASASTSRATPRCRA